MGKIGKIVGVAGAVAGVAYLANSGNREKLKKQFNKFNASYLKGLAKPSELEDAKMVDEGAMTSVQYYNELQEKSEEE
ncbi:hypothetical protein MUB24_16415 [Lederbergia sp. NSJ-179]|uniref:hypothetical protein n=1 Tax=Lederbergia sp. NSJ-179 TaxID=2931402 RepID=UPI001FD137F8|nr:hypothetical protein [Lederbergia sp. NSJ-179]MCJ7842453.1 hypothetical protein [Lederbergia sp. NSJ-179]